MLRWEVIDMGANFNKRPPSKRSAATSPHAGILAAAALHPQWIKSMDGDKVPYVWLSGYEINIPFNDEWLDMPGLSYERFAQQIRLHADGRRTTMEGFAVPVFVQK